VIDKKELYPIYGVWGKPFWQTKAFYFVMGLLLCLLVVCIVWFLMKKYVLKKPQKASWEIALSELEQLKALFLEHKIAGKPFYLTLTSIMKEYLHKRYNYDVLGTTDQELRIFLKKKRFDKGLLDGITQMLEGVQFVKFANAKAIREKMEQDLIRAHDIILKTIPK